MAQVYECKMTTVATVNIRANSAEEARNYIRMLSFEALQNVTSSYDVDYDDYVVGEVDEEAAIDISD